MLDYNECVSWGVIGDKVFVFNEETKDIFMFANLTKEVWLLIKSVKEIDQLEMIINERQEKNLSAEISNVINNLERKGLLKR